eukprot:364380-Chlamydomonas_euryale.AAC.10
MVDGHELVLRVSDDCARAEARAARPAARLATRAHEHVAGVAVGVEEPDVEDADAVHVGGGEAAGTHLARVTLVPNAAAVAAAGWRRARERGEVGGAAPHGAGCAHHGGGAAGVAECGVACAHQHARRNARKAAVVEQVGCDLAHCGLAHAHGRLPAGVAQLAADVALWVVGRERLLVARLEDGGLASGFVGEEVGAAHAVGRRFGLLASA